MDFADGGDLHQAIKSRNGDRIPEPQVLDWFTQTTCALHHVHQRKILHRDLKTQNIFLTKQGMIKLGDFGIARVLEATKEFAKTMVGTPYYLSPEIIEELPYNFKSDVWSLGVVLYEMATLKHPFQADNLQRLAIKILHGTYPPPDSDMYSGDLISLISRMLCKSADDRPTLVDILCMPFLVPVVSEVVATYSLEHPVPEGTQTRIPASEGQRSQPRGAGSAARLLRSMKDQEPPVVQSMDCEDTVLYASVKVDSASVDEGFVHQGNETAPVEAVLEQDLATLPLQSADPQSEEEQPNGPEEGQYEDDFEDYEGSEEPQGANLDAVDTAAGNAGKVEALRTYLQGQVEEEDFQAVYSVVRAGEAQAHDDATLQERVGGHLAMDKLLPLFQLLVFLEDLVQTA